MDIAQLVAGLTQRDAKSACSCMTALEEESARGAAVYPFINVFIDLLDSPRSYERNRALRLIAANARWDDASMLRQAVPGILRALKDEKPITMRTCLAALPSITAACPQLAQVFRDALTNADFSGYADSMRPLLEKDRLAALDAIPQK